MLAQALQRKISALSKKRMRLHSRLAVLEVVEARYGNQSHHREELQPEPNRAPIYSAANATLLRHQHFARNSSRLSCGRQRRMAKRLILTIQLVPIPVDMMQKSTW